MSRHADRSGWPRVERGEALGPRRGRLLLLVLAGCAAVAAAATAQSVRLDLDRSEMTLADRALLQVTVEGAKAEPKLSPPASLDLRFVGKSDQVSIVNGSFSHRVMHQWVLLPKEEGEFEIGPATIVVGDQTHSSQTVKLKVLPATASAQPRSSRPVFVTAEVSEDHPFVGEQMIYVWRFYRRARVGDPRLDSLDLAGFLVEDLGDVRQLQVTEGGLQYEVSEIRKALFAQRAGEITIPPSRLVVQVVQSASRRIDPFEGVSTPFDEFFGRLRTETVNLVTDPIVVTARPLPAPPAGFSGLVGDFDVSASLSSTRAAVGESLTQRIVVSGSGNLNLMGDLPLDDAEGFKVYRDQPRVEITRSESGIRGAKTWSRALVPQAPGEARVPETRLVYFDPNSEQYLTETAPAVVLDVVPNPAAEDLMLTGARSPGSGKIAVRIVAEDLAPIRGGAELVGGRAPQALFPALLALPPLAFVALLVARRRADRLASDVGLRRRRGALRTAIGAIGRHGDLQPRDASSVLRRYIGDRVGAEGQALTARECAQRLASLGAGEALVAEVRALLERFEAADFGGAASSPVPAAELRSTLERLERELRRER